MASDEFYCFDTSFLNQIFKTPKTHRFCFFFIDHTHTRSHEVNLIPNLKYVDYILTEWHTSKEKKKTTHLYAHNTHHIRINLTLGDKMLHD